MPKQRQGEDIPLPSAEAAPPPRRRRGFTIVPFLGDLVAMLRLLRDKRSATWAKLLVVAAVAYVIWPLDALPDAVPVITWLDDVGLVLALRLLMHRQLEPYRYPLGESPPELPPPVDAARAKA